MPLGCSLVGGQVGGGAHPKENDVHAGIPEEITITFNDHLESINKLANRFRMSYGH